MKLGFLACAFGAAALLMQSAQAAHACSVCIAGTDDPTAGAFNASVLFLLATPYLVVGSIAAVLFFVYRRAVSSDQEQGGEADVHLALKQEESGR